MNYKICLVLKMNKPTTVEHTSDNLLWIDFKGKEIRIEQDKEFNNGKLQITVDEDLKEIKDD